jgi:hypothetical protein
VANLQNMNRQANYAHYLMGLLGSNSLLVWHREPAYVSNLRCTASEFPVPVSMT